MQMRLSKYLKYSVYILYLYFINICANDEVYDIIVAKDGSGQFITINSAISSLPMYCYQRTIIYIKNGIYNEKFRVNQDFITLLGESADSTIIQYSQLREDWENNKNEVGFAVINIHADDIILKNLTVINTQPQIGPHAFCIYGTGTRTILLNCIIKTKGADAVALWNYKSGMYYHANCYFEGAVDFVCPRGWCYIDNSSFYEVKKTATLWHAGITDKSQKLVIKNSYFDGVNGFQLGRHHYEAQFYLIHCNFSKNMGDLPIYRVTYPESPEKNRPYFYGDRSYFYNCEKENGNYSWFNDNLKTADSSLTAEKITPVWTFNNQWDPENKTLPYLLDYSIDSNTVILEFSEKLSIKGDLILSSNSGLTLKFKMGKGRERTMFTANQIIQKNDIEKGLTVTSGKLMATIATVNSREIKTIQFKK